MVLLFIMEANESLTIHIGIGGSVALWWWNINSSYPSNAQPKFSHNTQSEFGIVGSLTGYRVVTYHSHTSK